MLMKNLCIIPARGGSKRIPRKNIKPFMGKPIIAYSIDAALKSGIFDDVMVSTDDEEIAEVARQFNASIPFFRSARTADDHATLADVIDEVLALYDSKGSRYDNFCCILATAPFVNAKLLSDSFNFFIEKNFDSLRPITGFSYPIQRSFRMNEDGRVSFFFPEYALSRSQDLEKAYHDAGLFYWGKTSKGLRGSVRGGYVIDEGLCQDIDTDDDWRIAEMKYQLLLRKTTSILFQ